MRHGIKQEIIKGLPGRLTYRISEDGKSITCLKCGMTSYNENDVKYLYCGNCHGFHNRTAELIKQEAG